MAVALLVPITLKTTVVLIAAWLATRAMARCSAASRHLVWTLAVVAALALPAVQMAGPRWELPVLGSDPGDAATQVGSQSDPTSQRWPDGPRSRTVLDTPRVIGSDPLYEATQPFDTPRVMGSDPIYEATQPLDTPRGGGLTPLAILAMTWLAGVAIALLRLGAGLIWVRRVTRRAVDVDDTEWQAILHETMALLGVTRGVSLKLSAETTIPVACGIWTPTVLLPADAGAWPAERRRVVLLHEIAHVARHDCLTQTIAQLGRAVHWFNPLAHVAVARLRTEQERACDDLVLAAGTDAPSYADHLFEIARGFRAGRCPAWATLAMARPSQLEGRVVAILDEHRNRRPPARWVRAAVGAAAVALTLPIGVLQLTAAAGPAGVPAAPVMTAGERVAASMAIEASEPAPAPAPLAAGWHETQTQAQAQEPVPLSDQIDVAVSAAMQFADMLADLDFDLDFDFDFDVDVDPDPDPDPVADPDPNPNPKVLVGSSRSKSVLGLAGAAKAQTQSQSQSSTVSDETRRRVADALMTALTDENEEVREQALNALAGMRDPRAIPGLLRALRDTSVGVRERAVNALAQFDTPEALDGVLSALKDQSPDVREHAARHLAALGSRGRLNDAKYVDVLSALLKDAAPDVREMGIVALGRMRRPESVPVLLPLLKDMNEDVRQQAAVALGFIADPRAIDALTAALKDPQPDVREQAAIALGRIARGQRRGAQPGVPPVPPVPPRPPRGVQLDADAIHELAARAQEEAQRSLEELQRNQEDFQRRQEDLQRRLR